MVWNDALCCGIEHQTPYQLRAQIKALVEALGRANTEGQRNAIKKQLDRGINKLERSIAVYGMINLRTDGKKVILAQKLKQPRSKADKWDIHCLEPGPDGRLRYVSTP